jgi:hypothetical protein
MQYNKETKSLIISCDFNEELKDIPNDTQIIIFENEEPKYLMFNQKVDNLPQNLTHLTFGFYFNQKIDNLPKNLTHLNFGDLFLNKIDNLPKNLTHLTFKCWFNEKLCNLPKNLKLLKLGWFFQNDFIFPKNLKKLLLTCNNKLINNIPKHIEKIYIDFDICEKHNSKIDNLPLTIKEIVIKDKKFKKYIKIPFGCILTIKKIE